MVLSCRCVCVFHVHLREWRWKLYYLVPSALDRGECWASRLGRFSTPAKLLPLHVKYEAGRCGEQTDLLYCAVRVSASNATGRSLTSVPSALVCVCVCHFFQYVSYEYMWQIVVKIQMNIVILEVVLTFALSVFSALRIAVTRRRHVSSVCSRTLKSCLVMYSLCKIVQLL